MMSQPGKLSLACLSPGEYKMNKGISFSLTFFGLDSHTYWRSLIITYQFFFPHNRCPLNIIVYHHTLLSYYVAFDSQTVTVVSASKTFFFLSFQVQCFLTDTTVSSRAAQLHFSFLSHEILNTSWLLGFMTVSIYYRDEKRTHRTTRTAHPVLFYSVNITYVAYVACFFSHF